MKPTVWACRKCGAMWLLFEEPKPASWSLLNGSQRPGKCCDNAPMDDLLRVQVDDDTLEAALAVRSMIAGVSSAR